LTQCIVKPYIVPVTIWVPDLSGVPGPRYKAIAEALAADLRSGRLKPGERLPTHRELAYRLGVTVGTVTRAYAEAQHRGIVDGQVGRGSFLAQPALATGGFGIFESEPAELFEMSLAFPPPQASDDLLQRTLTEIARQPGAAQLLGYQPHAGMAHHRAAGTAWIARHGLSVPAEQVIVTAGAQHGLAIVLGALLRPGDLLLTEALTYPGIRAVAELYRLRLKGVAMDEEGLRPDHLEAICREEQPSALYCMPSLQNPTGAVMSPERRHAIAGIARRYQLALLEDDIHGFLAAAQPPLSALVPELGHYLLGTSKSLAPGLRVGFLAVPPGRTAPFIATVRATNWMAPPLLTEVAARWIADGTAAELAAAQLKAAVERQRLARRILAGQDYRAHPHSFFGMLHMPARWRAADLVAAAARQGLRLRAADAFSVEPRAPEAIRLCIGAPAEMSRLADGLGRLAALLAEGPTADNLIV
jgi:DNA-binding transcriptional MocR family regulator